MLGGLNQEIDCLLCGWGSGSSQALRELLQVTNEGMVSLKGTTDEAVAAAQEVLLSVSAHAKQRHNCPPPARAYVRVCVCACVYARMCMCALHALRCG
jgi:hypothetical protein